MRVGHLGWRLRRSPCAGTTRPWRRSGEWGEGSACGLRELRAGGTFAAGFRLAILRDGAECAGPHDALEGELEARLLHARPDQLTLVSRHADLVLVEAG